MDSKKQALLRITNLGRKEHGFEIKLNPNLSNLRRTNTNSKLILKVQQIDGVNGMDGLQFGVAFPLFFWAQKGMSQAARINVDIAQQQSYRNKYSKTGRCAG